MLITEKQIEIKTFENYKRFFAYGCSMTGYGWPTWADILGQEIGSHKIYAGGGAGNQWISTQFFESNIAENFNNKDLVMIMFSNYMREDRYVPENKFIRGRLVRNTRWIPNANMMDKSVRWGRMFRKNRDWFNEYHARHRDLIYMYSIKEILVHKNCLSYFGTMGNEYNQLESLPTRIKNLSHHVLPFLGHSMLDAGCKGQWPQYSHIPKEYHPSPAQHFTYLKEVFPNIVWKEKTLAFVDFWEQFVHANSYDTTRSKWDEFKKENTTNYPGMLNCLEEDF